MPSLGLGLGLQRPVGSLLDADVQAFRAESGATDLSGLNRLVKYLKAESLYSNFVIHPMKSAQNAGSGATVYSLGGLTTNDITLANAPTWGPSGITLDGVNQYGFAADFLGGDVTTTFFARGNFTLNATGQSVYIAQYDAGASARSIQMAQNGGATNDAYQINRSTNGTTVDALQGTVTPPGVGADNCIVASWPAGTTGAALWVNKTAQTLNAALPEVSSKFDTAINVTFGAALSSGSPMQFAAGTYVAPAVLIGSYTTLQRETITDLINAL